MKKLIVYILLIGLYGYVSAHERHDISSQQTQQPVIYTCPMHPEIQSNKPGNCPKCGMKLVVQKKKSVQQKKSAPAKKSPSAKMDDTKMPPKRKATNKPAQPATYTCPMHPEIHASKPGNCPKCGMKLVKENPKTAAPQEA
jgi:DNA-directed RNA polymerase subunit RPC12/RpoP